MIEGNSIISINQQNRPILILITLDFCLLVSDYIEMASTLTKVSREHGVKDDIMRNPLNQKTRHHGEFLRDRRFLDLVEGRFQID